MSEDAALLAVAAVVIIVAAAYLSPRLRVATPVLLVVAGAVCSVVPGTPALLVEPEWILAVVLPPLLYSAAVNVPVIDFRRNLRPIAALSVVLVVVSAVLTGLLLSWLLPGLGLAAAIALGAVISPPDAVAATSVGRRLGLPPRLLTVLEGEGLVNDATALVLLRSAVAAIAGTVSFWGVAGDFAWAVVGALVFGGAAGAAAIWVRSRIRQQPVISTAISLVVPFVAFIPAEEAHASGVLAAVVAGLISGHQSVKRLTAQDRLTERTNWRTVQLLLENGVFLLMGYEITAIVDQVDPERLGIAESVGLGLVLTLALIVIRALFAVPLVASLRRTQRRAAVLAPRLERLLDRLAARTPPEGGERRHEKMTALFRRRQADVAFQANEGLDWRGGAVLAWSGMRGVVTLAAAQSLPHETPYREQLILIAFTVAIVTLVLQGGTLPLVIRWLGVRGTDEAAARLELVQLATEIAEAASGVLDNAALRRDDGGKFDPELLAAARERSAALVASLAGQLENPAEPSLISQRRELLRLVVGAEQAALLDARALGTYSSHALERAQRFVDAELTRLDGGGPAHH